MKVPKGGASWFDRACRYLDGLYQRGWVRIIVAPAVVAVPPWIVTQVLDRQQFNDAIAAASPGLAAFLTKYYVLFFLFASIYSWLILALGQAVGRRVASRNVTTEQLLSLSATIDNVVGHKLERFDRVARDTESGGLTAQTAFCSITQPTVQIAELMRGIADHFNAMRPGRNQLIRVSLAEIEADKLARIPIFFPKDEPIRSSVEELGKPNSTIMTAVRTRRIVIVESVQKELKKVRNPAFVDTGVGDDNAGSIICFPISLPNSKQIVFVISVSCDEEGYFKKALADVYFHILQRFALRVNLEYSLLQLKEKLCER